MKLIIARAYLITLVVLVTVGFIYALFTSSDARLFALTMVLVIGFISLTLWATTTVGNDIDKRS